jgi:hypothetical protein
MSETKCTNCNSCKDCNNEIETITELTIELKNRFFSSLVGKKYNKNNFYDALFDFLDKEKLNVKEDEEYLLEGPIFREAQTLGLINDEIIFSINNTEKIEKVLTKHIKKSGVYLFHFQYERKDEENLSLSEIWKKWDNIPPRGWISTWCSCGSFFVETADMNMSTQLNDPPIDSVDLSDACYRPVQIFVSEMKELQFLESGNMRFIMDENLSFIAAPYKYDKSLIYSFVDNPLELK